MGMGMADERCRVADERCRARDGETLSGLDGGHPATHYLDLYGIDISRACITIDVGPYPLSLSVECSLTAIIISSRPSPYPYRID
jgi:hypothetical protein